MGLLPDPPTGDPETDRSTDDDSGWSAARRVSIRRTVTVVNPHYVSDSDAGEGPSRVPPSTDRSFFYLPEDSEKYRWTGGMVQERDLGAAALLPPSAGQGRGQEQANLVRMDNHCRSSSNEASPALAGEYGQGRSESRKRTRRSSPHEQRAAPAAKRGCSARGRDPRDRTPPRDRSTESGRGQRRGRSEDRYQGRRDSRERRSESNTRSRNSLRSRNSSGASGTSGGAASNCPDLPPPSRVRDSRPPSRESERSIDRDDRRQPWERPRGQQFKNYRSPDGAQDFTSSEDEDKRRSRSPVRRSRTSSSLTRTPRICHGRDRGWGTGDERTCDAHNRPVNPALAGRTTCNVAAAAEDNSGNARGARAKETDCAPPKIRGLHQTVVLSEAIRAHQAEETGARPKTMSGLFTPDSARRGRSSSSESSVSPSTRAATKRGKKERSEEVDPGKAIWSKEEEEMNRRRERSAATPPRVEEERERYQRRERSRDGLRGGVKEKRLDRDQERKE